MPSVNVVNGKQIVVVEGGPVDRLVGFFAKPFRQMWHHRDLVQAILRREVAERFKGSAAGWVWAVVAPLLAIAVYTLVFSGRLQLPERYIVTRDPTLSYALFILSGIIIFNFWSEMAFRAPMLLHEYAHFIKQTIFPSDMLAVISTLRATLYTVISIVVLLIFQLSVLHSLPWTLLLMPFIFIPFIAFLIGMSWFLCALGAFTRDAGYLMINIVPLFMFATPVFYHQSAFGDPWDVVLYLNALTGYVEVMRDIMLAGRFPNWYVYGLTMFTSFFSFYFGYWFFDRYRNVIVDVI
jgi:lipopolysaccharide transport system permease protein